MFSLTPKQRLPYLGQSEKKAKNNEKRLQAIAETGASEDELFLISLLETAIIIANNKTATNDQIISEVKELLGGDRLEWLIDKLGIEICTTDHYYD